VATANGEAPARRRRGRGRKQPSTPADTGVALRRARLGLGLSLDDVRDRTGVSVVVLEALEAGDPSRAPGHEAAVVGLRRYADLVHLDGDALVATIEPSREPGALVGVTSASTHALDAGLGRPPGVGPVVTGGFAGHLRRYPVATEHLQAFTQTAQTSAVGAGSGAGGYSSGRVYGHTGMYPATPPLRIRQVVRPAAWPVRVLVWTTVVALVVAGAGLAVAHVRPQWMRDIHLARVPNAATASSRAPGRVGSGPRTTPSAPPGANSIVTTGAPGPNGVPITVRVADYTIVVATQAPCWVEATAPGTTAVFNKTLPAGVKQVLTPSGGQLSVQLGAAGVIVTVVVNGKQVPGWTFTPTSAPVALLFSTSPVPTP